MPQGIPEGLTREHILQALAELDEGAEHPCGKPTGYELLHDGKRYPPKAVISLAHRHLAGQILGPEEFSGGEAPGQANAVLRRLKFNVVKMMTRPGDVEQERERRRVIWSELSQGTDPTGVTPRTLRKLGIYGGAQGIWVDQARTRGLGPSGGGVTVGVLHTGRSYADDLDDDCIIYHYPRTRRRGSRDRDEVDATKAAGQLGLPLFVIIHPSPYAATRNVRLGWIEAWDDASATFLVSFEEQPAVLPLAISADEATFQLIDDAPKQSRAALARRGQQRFKFRVFKAMAPDASPAASMSSSCSMPPTSTPSRPEDRMTRGMASSSARPITAPSTPASSPSIPIHYTSTAAKEARAPIGSGSLAHRSDISKRSRTRMLCAGPGTAGKPDMLRPIP